MNNFGKNIKLDDNKTLLAEITKKLEDITLTDKLNIKKKTQKKKEVKKKEESINVLELKFYNKDSFDITKVEEGINKIKIKNSVQKIRFQYPRLKNYYLRPSYPNCTY